MSQSSTNAPARPASERERIKAAQAAIRARYRATPRVTLRLVAIRVLAPTRELDAAQGDVIELETSAVTWALLRRLRREGKIELTTLSERDRRRAADAWLADDDFYVQG